MEGLLGHGRWRARTTAHRLWATDALPGELAQVLPTPAYFTQTVELVNERRVAAEIPCGADVDAHVEAIQDYANAGFDELYVSQIGSEQDAFFTAYRDEVLPRVQAVQKAAAR